MLAIEIWWVPTIDTHQSVHDFQYISPIQNSIEHCIITQRIDFYRMFELIAAHPITLLGLTQSIFSFPFEKESKNLHFNLLFDFFPWLQEDPTIFRMFSVIDSSACVS